MITTFTMWCALGARFDGDEKEAASCYQRAVEKQAFQPKPHTMVYSAAMAFHEEGGEWGKMLALCGEGTAVEVAAKLHFGEATYFLRKCKILRHLGRDWTEAATLLREGTADMPSKAYWEKQLAILEELV